MSAKPVAEGKSLCSETYRLWPVPHGGFLLNCAGGVILGLGFQSVKLPPFPEQRFLSTSEMASCVGFPNLDVSGLSTSSAKALLARSIAATTMATVLLPVLVALKFYS